MDERKVFNVGDIVRTRTSGYLVKVTKPKPLIFTAFEGVVVGRDVKPSIMYDEKFPVGFRSIGWNSSVFDLYFPKKLSKVKVL